MSPGQIVLLVYALLMLIGGIIGYTSAGSKASLTAGAASAAALGAAWLWARSSPGPGLWLGAVISLALCAVFAVRLSKTGKFMPSGMLLVVSLLALVALVYSSLRAGKS